MGRDEVIRSLLRLGIPRHMIECGIMAKFRCEYCDAPLLSSLDTYYSWECDHIVPVSANGGADSANVAACCRVCNKLKGSIAPTDPGLADAPREQRVAWAKQVVTQRRNSLEQKYSDARRLLLGLLEYPEGSPESLV